MPLALDRDSVRTEHHQVEERFTGSSPISAVFICQELLSRFHSDGDPEDLENGITHLRVAVAELREMDNSTGNIYPLCLHNLGESAWHVKFPYILK